MENTSYHKWATTIVMNCLCRALNSRSQTPESLDYSLDYSLGVGSMSAYT